MNSDLMDATGGSCSLFLCPRQHDFSFDDDSVLISRLQQAGFISEKIGAQGAENRYLTGARFLNHIAYLGCSPAIQFEASEDNSEFCFIQVHQYQSARLIRSNKQSRSPHCPHCNSAVRTWDENSISATILCESCNTVSGLEKFDWRKMAGYARVFIEITDIFPKEAIPQQSFLDKLASMTDTDWLYFYSCQ